jgi:hypothetical protein
MSDNCNEPSDHEFSNLSDSDPDGQIATDGKSETYDDAAKEDEMSHVLCVILQQQMATNEVSKTY